MGDVALTTDYLEQVNQHHYGKDIIEGMYSFNLTFYSRWHELIWKLFYRWYLAVIGWKLECSCLPCPTRFGFSKSVSYLFACL